MSGQTHTNMQGTKSNAYLGAFWFQSKEKWSVRWMRRRSWKVNNGGGKREDGGTKIGKSNKQWTDSNQQIKGKHVDGGGDIKWSMRCVFRGNNGVQKSRSSRIRKPEFICTIMSWSCCMGDKEGRCRKLIKPNWFMPKAKGLWGLGLIQIMLREVWVDHAKGKKDMLEAC